MISVPFQGLPGLQGPPGFSGPKGPPVRELTLIGGQAGGELGRGEVPYLFFNSLPSCLPGPPGERGTIWAPGTERRIGE